VKVQSVTAGGGARLRLDAVRNQERIVVAAAGAFAELGAEVTLEEVARRAGVGVATVYRRFRNRDQLVRAVVAHVLTAEIEPVAEIETTTRGATSPPPWRRAWRPSRRTARWSRSPTRPGRSTSTSSTATCTGSTGC
jgi:AcrR family transcriptional regulator